MSFRDLVSSLIRATACERLPHGKAVAAALATCIVFLTASDGHAASNSSTEFLTMPFLSPASPAGIDQPSSTSFMNRFVECPQTLLSQNVLASMVSYVPLAPVTTANSFDNQNIIPAADPIVGIASMYNPNDPNDRDSGDGETASGELYDAESWTAAIRIDLREQFGGVRSGENYRPAFALVQSGGKQAIVKINDVGPLKPGRIIDLNEQTMRYFDPTLQVGLIDDVSVTLLAGHNWTIGPVGNDRPVSIASRFDE
jgi:rare lipoprotein A